MDSERSDAKSRPAMAGISQYFGCLHDRRQPEKADYPLLAIVAVVVFGTLAGREGWLKLADWAELDWYSMSDPHSRLEVTLS